MTNLSGFDGNVALWVFRPDVLGARADQAVVAVLLEYVRGPAGDATDREDWREQVGVDAERVIRGRRVKVDVGVQLFFVLHERFDALRHLEPDRLTGPLAEIARHLPEVRGARIFRVIHAMSETGNLFLASELGPDDLFGLVEARGGTDLEQHPHDVGVGATVQRPLERANRGDDGRMDVC